MPGKMNPMKFERILVTGGCGFLGQYLVNDLFAAFPHLHIHMLDLVPHSDSFSRFGNNPNLSISFGKDICDYESIEDEFKDIDLVIHLAGFISFSLKDKERLEEVNVRGTQNVLRAMAANKIEYLIYASSVASLGYGNDRNHPIDETYEFDWNIARRKKKYYMLSKYLADLEIEKASKEGLQVVVFYPGLMFGPGDMRNSSRMIQAIKNRKIPTVPKGGTNVIDVRDVSAGIVNFLQKGISEGKYLLSGYNLTFREIFATIAGEFSVPPPKIPLPGFLNPVLFPLFLFIERLAKNRVELTADCFDSSFKFRYFDNSKAGNELGWEPKIPFRQSIRDSIKWLDSNGFFKK